MHSVASNPPPPRQQPREKVVVGLSGGVDSSVAAQLLRGQYDVTALFMKNWDEDDRDGHCSAAQDLGDARSVAEHLGLPLVTRNFAAEYWDSVFSHCLEEFRRGRTPNPDILCNREIKFKVFLDQALELGARYIATGHYARRLAGADGWQLAKARDVNKDQSYFLYTLGQQQLEHCLFPLGELHKDEVRQLAQQAGLVTHGKKDSTGICFIGERNFKPFLMRYLPAQPGPIQTPEGKVIGRHDGLMYHTLGQRKGLGIGGLKDATESAWYVVAKDLTANALIVAQGHDHPLLFSRRLRAVDLSWVAGRAPELPLACHCKTRYRQPNQACTITAIDDGVASVEFSRPQRAVTLGQSVVFYAGEICLGGGIIDASD